MAALGKDTLRVLDLLQMELLGHDALELCCIAGRRGLPRVIGVPEINRPGLALTGFFESFAHERMQVFGQGEVAYLRKIQNERDSANSEGTNPVIDEFFSYNVPCCVFTRGLSPTEEFLEAAERSFCPILQTPLGASEFTNRILRVLSNIFAPTKTMHGVLVEVYGVGILIMGQSGVGKSETALELVERGHRLVADDIIEIRCVNGNVIIGRGANSHIGHHMEIRGLGVINVMQLYGVGAIRDQKEVQLVVQLDKWEEGKEYDRLGINQAEINLLGVNVPQLKVPVGPTRNMPIIIEVAAMNLRLKKMGYDSARDFNQNILKWIETDEAKAAYYNNDDLY